MFFDFFQAARGVDFWDHVRFSVRVTVRVTVRVRVRVRVSWLGLAG